MIFSYFFFSSFKQGRCGATPVAVQEPGSQAANLTLLTA